MPAAGTAQATNLRMSRTSTHPPMAVRKGAVLDIRGWLQRVGVTVYCNVFLGCRVLVD